MESSSTNNLLKFTTEQVHKISEKLNEILGKEGPQIVDQNYQGETLNEEGLPIIDISESVIDDSISTPKPSVTTEFARDALPLWALSSVEIQRRRAERDRVLDILEEEERIESERDKEREEEEKQIALQNRRQAAKQEISGLKAARELQKKMGHALVRSVNEMSPKEIATDERSDLDKEPEKARKDSKPTKHVSFALADENAGEPNASLEPSGSEVQFSWGDVVPARLQASKPTMKSDVVERYPHAKNQIKESSERDSDDESISFINSDDGIGVPQSDSHDGINETSEDEDPQFLDEYDMDTAHHQREVALAYYEKRNKIASQASVALTSHTHDPDEDPWDKPEVPLEASLAGERPKPEISRFKANRILEASTSLEGSILPVSQYHLVQQSIHTGKLEDGKLIGADEADSGEEDAKAILELLSRGEPENTEPTVAVQSISIPSSSQTKTRPKTSKFKLAQSGASEANNSSPNFRTSKSVTERDMKRRFVPTVASQVKERITNVRPTMSHSGTATPPSQAGRSSPKLPSSDAIEEVVSELPPTRGAPVPSHFRKFRRL